MKTHKIIIFDALGNSVNVYELPEKNMDSEETEDWINEATKHNTNHCNWFTVTEKTKINNNTDLKI